MSTRPGHLRARTGAQDPHAAERTWSHTSTCLKHLRKPSISPFPRRDPSLHGGDGVSLSAVRFLRCWPGAPPPRGNTELSYCPGHPLSYCPGHPVGARAGSTGRTMRAGKPTQHRDVHRQRQHTRKVSQSSGDSAADAHVLCPTPSPRPGRSGGGGSVVSPVRPPASHTERRPACLVLYCGERLHRCRGHVHKMSEEAEFKYFCHGGADSFTFYSKAP